MKANFEETDMPLSEMNPEKEYLIVSISTDDEEFRSFLFTLGCYSGEKIILVAKKRRNLTIGVKDARYTIDRELADVIEVEAA